MTSGSSRRRSGRRSPSGWRCGCGVAGILCAASTGQGFGALTLVTTEFSDANGWAAPQYGPTIKVVYEPSLQGPEVCGRGGNDVICARPSW